ncbi:MAG: hypothetical protein OYH77_05380 [Pseudomonadota bacterium]|nr:hypothetical protein [Pseudomonadota bacterium]
MKSIILLALLTTACSSEAYNPYDLQRQTKNKESNQTATNPNNSPAEEEPMAGTAPVSQPASPQPAAPNSSAPNPVHNPAPAPAPAPGTWKALKREDCNRIGCWIDPDYGQFLYGTFDLDKDNCINKQEAIEYAREKCLSSKRPISFLTCPVTEYNQPIHGSWQARCYFKDITTCDCEV